MHVELSLLERPELKATLAGSQSFRGIDLTEGALPPHFLLQGALEKLEAGEPAVWHSSFLFILSLHHHKLAIGSGGFKGAPKDRVVEIGYGVAPSWRRKGLATEAVIALAHFAFSRDDIDVVVAQTLKSNIASQRVLQKADFTQTDTKDSEEGELILWQLTRDDFVVD
jgi:[ribosomal protein S5]-alanine N-acetyltransferase